MTSHVDLLGLLYAVAAALAGLVAAALLSLAAGALSLVWSAARGDSTLAAQVTSFAFFLAAMVLAAWGLANWWVGRALRRRVRWARHAGLGLAVVDFFILPFGTALGVYALWVLLNNETRRLFEGDAVAGQP